MTAQQLNDAVKATARDATIGDAEALRRIAKLCDQAEVERRINKALKAYLTESDRV